jgi:hypothetical protein
MKKNVSQFKLQYLTLLLYDGIVILCKLHDCSITNIPMASKTKTKVKNCNAAMTYFVVLQYVTYSLGEKMIDWSSYLLHKRPEVSFSAIQ